MSRTQLYILLAILSAAVLGLSSYIVWDLYQTEEDDTIPEHAIPTVNEDTKESAVPEEPEENTSLNTEYRSETINWLTYTNKEMGITLKYPDDWTLSDELTDMSETVGTEGAFTLQVDISKEDYIFRLQIPAGSGPSQCVYTESETEGMQGLYYDNYTEIVNQEREYRRSFTGGETPMYIICRKEESGNFSTWVGPGYVSYKVPSSVDTEMLETLDEILLSYESIGN